MDARDKPGHDELVERPSLYAIALPLQRRVNKATSLYLSYTATIRRLASARAISTKAEVTSGPPTRMRVGVFILFHS
ncbi:hypothetical protein ABIF05_008888 [Bradyrhizobium elkanii]